MVHHMLAVFGAVTARPPVGLESPSALLRPHAKPGDLQELEQEDVECKAVLERLYEGLKASSRAMAFPGKGCGFGYERGPYCSLAVKGGVHVLFAGEVSEWPGINAVEAAHDAFVRNTEPPEADDAHWLLDFYDSFISTDSPHSHEEILQSALECLSEIKGTFAFVIYDAVHHRVLAARDSEGGQPLFWGATDSGQLVFGSAIEDLGVCNPTATSFPKGTLFASERHSTYNPGPEGWVIEGDEYPGELLSFLKADEDHWKSVKAIPRITSKGCVAGAVYHVSSQPDITHPMAH
mmetsp:Transcript_12018/g.25842  ORF Transcript_12018/g.25842 Transcript_12018/m.25842 type:complete len:293 (-) Transcript_12018:644-1522(-)|eukprot:CAMPEP_0202890198 /NCGR_PEP_ID=MMETSP1392-20130828/701_1 /ASSEMBLY_ACC=CAM_ASM_000868 /TAXON_ID=225041 /ORGANISM="Chlamydomonas chlamydogama, Strain SAG 11-48b" /LENGTH=292 /DNA_ID=CAMNT_0049573733 /DNA_START=124 /DNA_END=1002 /DNA_ORIENTATION=+